MTRKLDARALESLESVLEHRTVDFFENVRSNLDHVVRTNAKDVCIERGVMESTQGQTVRDHGLASLVRVRQDVRRVEQLPMSQAADGAVLPVRL